MNIINSTVAHTIRLRYNISVTVMAMELEQKPADESGYHGPECATLYLDYDMYVFHRQLSLYTVYIQITAPP